MVGPVIYTFGNEEQKKKFLPDILEFNTWWCQGYSEPGSGSDLASLKTKAFVFRDAKSDPDPGSEYPWHHHVLNSRISGKNFFFCSSLPKV